MELRLYSFVNFYLSSIQAGIQTGHAAVRLLRKYTKGLENKLDKNRIAIENKHDVHRVMVNEWADKHETFIILNGGDSKGITNAYEVLSKSGFPFCAFNESVDALNGMMTCVVTILPESVFGSQLEPSKYPPSIIWSTYSYRPKEGQSILYDHEHQYYELIELLKRSKLAS